jgi:hypothetical protein
MPPALPEEAEFVAWLQGDAAVTAILVGGIYASSGLTRLGIHRETTAAVFDAAGQVQPFALVKARAPVSDSNLFDEDERVIAQTQMIEVWCYQYVGYDQIRAAQNAIFSRTQGHAFTNAYKAQWAYTTPQQVDTGALNGASCQRMDWRIKRLRKA